MNLKNIFKKLVLIDLSLVVLMVVFTFLESQTVMTFNENVNQMPDMFSILALIYLVAWLICLYFLYKFKPIGKQFYFFIPKLLQVDAR